MRKISNEEFDSVARDIIKEDKISETACAKLLAALYFEDLDSNEALHYSKMSNTWKQGRDSLTEIKMISILSVLYDRMKDFLRREWDKSVFSELISDNQFKKIKSSFNDLESLNATCNILNLAKGIMVFDDEADVSWDTTSEVTINEYED